ncbi:MAG: AAA family ATPase, partial [Bacteroidota bacterium]
MKDEISKRMAVVAPTGVAAINAGGQTIHSLFQLPFGPILPGQLEKEMKVRKFRRKKINLLRSLDLLIIDEISMVRADVLDGIDMVMRRYRDRKLPFGGVQLLMIGDLHQLPPVVRDQDWQQLGQHYQTAYFFGSLALRQTDYLTIQLKHIYRQSDPVFIQLLNQVRNNQLGTGVLQTLNSRYQADFKEEEHEGYITLTSHVASARRINDERMAQLTTPSVHYDALIDGDFPEHAYPNEKKLELKVGAQVMFLRNDVSEAKLYYNGKIGFVYELEEEFVHVKCPDMSAPIAVSYEEWSNRRYELNEDTKEVEEKILGTFNQIPLKPAWAITIHKSQGLTFEKVVIDAQAAFAHGQVYVALSRCKSFEGIVLRTQINHSSVRTDTVVKNYSETAAQNQPDEAHLAKAQKEYQQKLVRRLFNFRQINYRFDQALKAISDGEKS